MNYQIIRNKYTTLINIHIYIFLDINSTYIVQCFKDQEPCKSLRFMSRHVDDNGIIINTYKYNLGLDINDSF